MPGDIIAERCTVQIQSPLLLYVHVILLALTRTSAQKKIPCEVKTSNTPMRGVMDGRASGSTSVHDSLVLVILVASVTVLAGAHADAQWMSKSAGCGKDRSRMGVLTVNSVGLVLWPMLWWSVIGKRARVEVMLVACMAWTVLLCAVDMEAMVTGEAPRTGTSETVYSPSLAAQAGGLVGLTFSLGAMLGGGDSEQKRLARTIVISALLICVACIIPQPIVSLGEERQQLVFASQKVGFNAAVGLIVTGMAFVVKADD